MNDTRWLTLTRLKRRLNIENATLTESDNARMESALRAAQAEIEAATGRRFAPVYATLSHWAREGQTSLLLRDDLLDLVSITDAHGAVFDTNAVTWDSNSVNLNAPAGFAGGEVNVTGWWAHHPSPSQAFRPSGDALNGGISNTATTLVVNNATGADTWGDTPRFTPGQILRITNELIRVTAITGNTLTVRRGENGTVAAVHSSGTAIQVYVAGFLVESLGLRLGAWLYREPDAEHGREWPRGIENGIAKLRKIRF